MGRGWGACWLAAGRASPPRCCCSVRLPHFCTPSITLILLPSLLGACVFPALLLPDQAPSLTHAAGGEFPSQMGLLGGGGKGCSAELHLVPAIERELQAFQEGIKQEKR